MDAALVYGFTLKRRTQNRTEGFFGGEELFFFALVIIGFGKSYIKPRGTYG